MAYKLSDIKDSDTREFIDDEIVAQGKQFRDSEKGSYLLSQFGLCRDCIYFSYSATEFNIVRAVCNAIDGYPMRLKSNNPIQNCNDYVKKGQLDIWEMKSMAYIIDTHKKEAGFIK